MHIGVCLLKTKSCFYSECVVIGGIQGCRYDNFRWHRWRQSWYNERGCTMRYMYVFYWRNMIWGIWCQKQVSQTGISNYTPQFTVGCNYLSLPEIILTTCNTALISFSTLCRYSYRWEFLSIRLVNNAQKACYFEDPHFSFDTLPISMASNCTCVFGLDTQYHT